MNTHWKDWCWTWSSSSLVIWCKQTTHWQSPWRWERLRAGEEGVRGWDGWTASLMQWTWTWANLGIRWGQGGLACCSPWGCKDSDTTGPLNDSSNIINCGQYTVQYITRTYSAAYNCKFVPFGRHLSISHTLQLLVAITLLCFYNFSFFLFHI